MSTESLFLCTTWGNYGCYSPVFWSDLGTLPRGRVIQDVIPVDPTCATSCETFGTVSQFSCVSVGSEIFVIGGKQDTTRWDLDLDDDGLTNAVYSTNVAGRRSDFTWKKHSNLLLARNPMATLVSGNHIFVFGSREKIASMDYWTPRQHWGECLDISSSSWKPLLPHPDPNLSHINYCGVLNNKKNKNKKSIYMGLFHLKGCQTVSIDVDVTQPSQCSLTNCTSYVFYRSLTASTILENVMYVYTDEKKVYATDALHPTPSFALLEVGRLDILFEIPDAQFVKLIVTEDQKLGVLLSRPANPSQLFVDLVTFAVCIRQYKDEVFVAHAVNVSRNPTYIVEGTYLHAALLISRPRQRRY